jgi:hypothetical protein
MRSNHGAVSARSITPRRESGFAPVEGLFRTHPTSPDRPHEPPSRKNAWRRIRPKGNTELAGRYRNVARRTARSVRPLWPGAALENGLLLSPRLLDPDRSGAVAHLSASPPARGAARSARASTRTAAASDDSRSTINPVVPGVLDQPSTRLDEALPRDWFSDQVSIRVGSTSRRHRLPRL